MIMSSNALKLFSEELTNKDYAFVIDESGQLKSVYWPENVEVPDCVIAICKAFGISDPESVNPHTIH
jgi:hypothetical protein